VRLAGDSVTPSHVSAVHTSQQPVESEQGNRSPSGIVRRSSAFGYMGAMKWTSVLRVVRRGLFTSVTRQALPTMEKPANKGIYPSCEGYRRVQLKQIEWTKNDGKRVWEKAGYSDLVIRRSLELLGTITLITLFSHFFFMARPEYSPKRLRDKAKSS
ncbi:hypothetical protein LSAT2_028991, partial [Lamellibrachia satsuma]